MITLKVTLSNLAEKQKIFYHLTLYAVLFWASGVIWDE